MDPKQTEGQNSGSGTLSTGANISRTMDALNVNERKSATSNSPFAKHHFDKVAPGTGDILIDPSAGSIISSAPAENKGINRGRLIQFGLIFGGIALIALVIFTVVMVINNQPKKSSSSANNNVAVNYQEAFNRYANWMINGEDSDSDLTAEALANSATYYARKAFTNKNEEKAFFKASVTLYEDFRSAFENSSLASYNLLSSVVASDYYNLSFYEKYITEMNFSESDLIGLALKYEDNLRGYLDAIYDELQEQNPAGRIFAAYGKQYSEQASKWYSAMRDGGCLSEEGIDTECRNSVVEQTPEIGDVYSESVALMVKMSNEANSAINTVYSDISVINKELDSPTKNYEATDTEEPDNNVETGNES